MQIYGNLFDRGRRQFVKTNGDQASDTGLKKDEPICGTVIAYKQDGVKHHFLESYDEVAESRDVKQ